jgi:hypothetical protein
LLADPVAVSVAVVPEEEPLLPPLQAVSSATSAAASNVTEIDRRTMRWLFPI